VVVAFACAEDLGLPLQALVVRKLGAATNPELAIGAVSETGVRWLDRNLAQATGSSDRYLEREIEAQVAEARRRQHEYAIGPGLQTIKDRTAIVVDDGIATGATALVACTSARDLGAREVILATPVASEHAVRFLEPAVDRIVVLQTPEPFFAVGLYYEQFDQVTDAEVKHYLALANDRGRVRP
jgi:putative phosphoribosyl transferase